MPNTNQTNLTEKVMLDALEDIRVELLVFYVQQVNTTLEKRFNGEKSDLGSKTLELYCEKKKKIVKVCNQIEGLTPPLLSKWVEENRHLP